MVGASESNHYFAASQTMVALIELHLITLFSSWEHQCWSCFDPFHRCWNAVTLPPRIPRTLRGSSRVDGRPGGLKKTKVNLFKTFLAYSFLLNCNYGLQGSKERFQKKKQNLSDLLVTSSPNECVGDLLDIIRFNDGRFLR